MKPILGVIFVTLTENAGTSQISILLEIGAGIHFHARDGTKTTPVFLLADITC